MFPAKRVAAEGGEWNLPFSSRVWCWLKGPSAVILIYLAGMLVLGGLGMLGLSIFWPMSIWIFACVALLLSRIPYWTDFFLESAESKAETFYRETFFQFDRHIDLQDARNLVKAYREGVEANVYLLTRSVLSELMVSSEKVAGVRERPKLEEVFNFLKKWWKKPLPAGVERAFLSFEEKKGSA